MTRGSARSRPGPLSRARLATVRLAVFDFDGVFTDNRVTVDQDGRESVTCTRADGLGLEALRREGVEAMVLSTEKNPVVARRCEKLKLPCVHGVADKWKALEEILRERGVEAARVLYLGNDVNDAGCLERVGVPVCVADSHPAVLPVARFITRRRGGDGAVREVCDLIVEARRAGARGREGRNG